MRCGVTINLIRGLFEMIDANADLPGVDAESAKKYFEKNGLNDIPQADKEFLLDIADGVVGALNVATRIYGEGKDVATLSEVLKHKLTGSRLWVAYKDWAKEDLETLVKGILSEDKSMLDKVDSMVGKV